ncbi:MAG: hypothetical protein ACC707_18540 [Thiohalomonadales bacterium]
MKTKSHAPTSKARILRAVASSTAIETGQTIKKIEATLKSKKSKFNKLELAS